MLLRRTKCSLYRGKARAALYEACCRTSSLHALYLHPTSHMLLETSARNVISNNKQATCKVSGSGPCVNYERLTRKNPGDFINMTQLRGCATAVAASRQPTLLHCASENQACIGIACRTCMQQALHCLVQLGLIVTTHGLRLTPLLKEKRRLCSMSISNIKDMQMTAMAFARSRARRSNRLCSRSTRRANS